jgi:GDP-6-deoxy-D-talose 4-dehydrogenase
VTKASKHACITGISGFTGKYLARVLTQAGWLVSGIGPDPVAGETSHLDVDIGNRDAIAQWLRDVQPTHVVHFAALSSVVGAPLPFYETNVLGTESLVEAIARSAPDLQHLIIASSANVYGSAVDGPIRETMSLRPANHYALSKAATELLAVKWFDRLPITITRPFNYTGIGQSENFVFAKLAGAFRRRDPRINLGNINVARDLSDVGFVCEAYRRLLDRPGTGETFNICSGTAISLHDAIRVFAELTNHRPEINIDKSLIRPDDISELIGCPDRLFAAVGRIVPMARRDLFAAMLSND